MGRRKICEKDIDISELVDGRGIYAIMHIDSSKVYIGQSGTIRTRALRHMNELRKGIHINAKLQNAYNKYGAESFKIITLEVTDDENLFDKEQFWASQYNSFSHGYNLAPIKENSVIWSIPDEQIDKYNYYKLNRDDVIQISHLLNKQVPMEQIAEKFNISVTTVFAIKTGKSWKNVTEGILNPEKLVFYKTLTREEVVEVSHLLNKKMSAVKIAEKLNINSPGVVMSIRKGTHYKEFSENIIQKEIREKEFVLSEEIVTKICHLLNLYVPMKEIEKIIPEASYFSILQIKNGKSFSKISDSILRPEVRGKTQEHLSVEQVISICEMLNERLTIEDISEKQGLPFYTISNIKSGRTFIDISDKILHKDIIESRKKNLSIETIIAICNMLNENISVSKIAKKYDISTTTVYSIKSGKLRGDVTKSILKPKIISTPNELSEEKVLEICYLFLDGLSINEVVKKLGLKRKLITLIRGMKIYEDITLPLLGHLKNKSLSEQEVIEICNLLNKGVPITKIAKKFGVCQQVISKIKNKKSWTEVSEDILKKESDSVPVVKIAKRRFLTEQEVIEICHLINQDVPITNIAEQYSVSYKTVAKIKNGQSWTEVSKNILSKAYIYKDERTVYRAT